ncbi:probable mitochondrial adenine nucleotide transporter BTL3 [Tanacetum coccineum]
MILLLLGLLASRLQSAGLQTKLLRHSDIVTFGPAFNNALSAFNAKMEIDLLSNPRLIGVCYAIGWVFPYSLFRSRAQLAQGISAGKEVDIGLDGGRDKPLRPADMLLYSWDGGFDIYVDLTCSSPLTQTGMIDFVQGHAELEKDAVILLKRIRKFSMTQDIGARTAIHIFISLNVNGSDGNLGKKLVTAGDGDGVVKKKKVGLRLKGKPAAVNTTKHLWAGAVAAMVSRTTVAPLERLKLEYMVYEASGNETFFNILCTAPFKALNFCTYDSYRKQLLRLTGNEETNNFERLFASAGAGMTASILCLPLDTIRTKLVAPGGGGSLRQSGKGVIFLR